MEEEETGSAGDLPLRGGNRIPGSEIEELASRSGGPGGQHVNTSSTRVTLRWNLRNSRGLHPAARARAESRLLGRLTRSGELVVHAGQHRSRARNRLLARQRLQALVDEALREAPPRKPTAPTRGSKQRRLDAKRRRGDLKSRRRERPDSES